MYFIMLSFRSEIVFFWSFQLFHAFVPICAMSDGKYFLYRILEENI